MTALLALGAAGATFLLLLALLRAVFVPKAEELGLRSFPSVLSLVIQAVLSLFSKKKPVKGNAPCKAEVTLSRATPLDRARLQKFLQLAGYPVPKEVAAAAPNAVQSVPLMYPIVESFRLCIQAMLLPSFPFNVLGSVLARNTSRLERSLRPSERLVYRCLVDPQFRATSKGHIEVDVCVTAATAANFAATSSTNGGGEVVWHNTLTVIIIGGAKRYKGALVQKQEDTTTSTSSSPAEASWPVTIDTWRLGADAGRLYGSLNGDLNPIHLHALTARLFGFARPIAHALYLTARAEASLQKAGLSSDAAYPAVLEAEFKRPTLLPATLHCALATAPPITDPLLSSATTTAAAAAQAVSTGGGVRFALLTADKSKEVLVGKLRCGAAAASS